MKSKPNSTGGGKLYEPTAEDKKKVESMVGCGATDEQVADFLEIGISTLRRHFKSELRKGRIKANTAVAGALYKNAMGGNVAAQIFWAKARMGWKEKSEIEIGGNIGGNFKTHVTISLKTKDDKDKDKK